MDQGYLVLAAMHIACLAKVAFYAGVLVGLVWLVKDAKPAQRHKAFVWLILFGIVGSLITSPIVKDHKKDGHMGEWIEEMMDDEDDEEGEE